MIFPNRARRSPWVGFLLKGLIPLLSDDRTLGYCKPERGSRALAEGVVKWFNATRVWFYQEGRGQDLFVHFSSITMQGYKTLAEGDKVSLRWKTPIEAHKRKT